MSNNTNNNNMENMFGRRNYELGESSSSSPRRHDEHDSLQGYVDADHDACLMSFGGLTLSDGYYSNLQEGRSRNQLSASSSEYLPLPYTLDDAPNSWTRPGFAQHNTETPYYPAPSSYLRDQHPTAIGMRPFYAPHSPNLPVANFNLFAPQPLSPNTASYQYPNSLPFRDQTATAFPPTLPNGTQVSLALLAHILSNPYKYMTDQKSSRPISSLLLESRRISSFIDDFVIAVTKSQDSLIAAACNSYGTSVMQTLIKVGKKRPVIAQVPALLADATVLLMTNPSGMHVVKQCFLELDAPKQRPLFEKMMEDDNWLKMAVDKNGCRGLNECLSNMVDSFRNRMIRRFVDYTQQLALDVYGNYVLQHVIGFDTVYTGAIVERLLPILESLCTIKNGSHLLERCLKTRHYAAIVNKLADSPRLMRFAIHESANYVIQTAIKRTQEENDHTLYCNLARKLLKEKEALLVNRHGKFVAKKLLENLDDGKKTYYQRHC